MWIDRAMKWLLPREERFFDFLERGADVARRCGELLVECCAENANGHRAEMVERMHGLEHEADQVIREVYDALNRTFVTPIDRSDIFALAGALEGVTDDIHATALQIIVHAMEDLPAGSCELADMIARACRLIDEAVHSLRDMRRLNEIRDHCHQLGELEKDGDRVFRMHVAEMFRTESDAIKLMKNKEFLEGLEQALDACDDVANALENVVIKNA